MIRALPALEGEKKKQKLGGLHFEILRPAAPCARLNCQPTQTQREQKRSNERKICTLVQISKRESLNIRSAQNLLVEKGAKRKGCMETF